MNYICIKYIYIILCNCSISMKTNINLNSLNGYHSKITYLHFTLPECCNLEQHWGLPCSNSPPM